MRVCGLDLSTARSAWLASVYIAVALASEWALHGGGGGASKGDSGKASRLS